MTGFGQASTQHQGVHYALELRSLNNKFFKALIRLPDELASLDAELETALRKRVQRGSLTLVAKFKIADTAAATQINDNALLGYIEHLEAIRDKVGDHTIHIDLTHLLSLPGVIQTADNTMDLIEQARPTLLSLLDQAIDQLDAMRVSEGKATGEVLRQQLEVIAQRLEIIKVRAPKVVGEYQAKLQQRMTELLNSAKLDVAMPDLIKEVAVFAERVDVLEETQRIAAHLERCHELLDQSGHPTEVAGRTLDFIAQELLREANTIASKSSDADISRAVVDIKSAIDRIKEQAQNVE